MSTQSTAVKEPDTLEYRLPRNVIPSCYEIRLSPDLENFTFAGEVKIHVDVQEPVREILLNSLDLHIHSAGATGENCTLPAEHTLIVESERLKLSFNEPLNAGKWVLDIKFEGELNDKLHGFYRSTYKDENGIKKVLATTQFQPTDARRAFPCWDEPDFKASFKITLVVDEKLTAISNGSLVSEKSLGKGKKEVTFKETIKMSTYIVAFVIGDYQCTQIKMAGKTPVRVCCVKGKENLTPFAHSVGVHSLNFFERYYGLPYAGDKLDLIAIPDFAFGAMENLGCVTFRESALLVDEKAGSHAELERVADVVAHEIAHMWFGDLTTMGWWNGIWLNEAFATFAEMMAVDAFKPEWQRWNSFGAARAAALVVDGLKSTRPIEYPVRHPHECEAMFDVLTYEKGASVLRMLEQYLGADVYCRGVSYYLDKHQFANTETSDLWDAFEHESKEPVRKLMDSWIFQKGYPMITVELNSSGKQLTLSQQRFFYLADSEEKQLFQVPVMLELKTAKGIESEKLLLSQEKITLDLDAEPEYVIVNAGGHGFYRVRYSAALMQKLSDNVLSKLSAIERFNLVNDTWAMVMAGHVSLSDYLGMLPGFQKDNDKNVWLVISGSLAYLERLVENDERKLLESYVQDLFGPVLARLGWVPAAGEDQITCQLRGIIVGTLGTTGNCRETQKRAKEEYSRFKKDKAAIEPNLVPALVNVVAAASDRPVYDEFVSAWKEGKTPQEEERYLYAQACFAQENLLRETLTRTTNGEVRTQNAPYLLRAVMMNVHGRKAAWEHLKNNWEYVTSKYPDNSIARLLEGITALICPQMEKDVVKFMREHPVRQGGKTIDQHIERLHVGVKFKEREQKNFAPALKQRGK